ncbi:MAG: aldose epimerase family protein [Candidatus Pelethousia sp.]|nr:aldose epimerase family protein [Candidatus Pelethousia sp.]
MISSRSFGFTAKGEAVTCFRLQNAVGAYADILTFGATIQSFCAVGRDGRLLDVALGYDDVAGYEAGNAFLGAALGRYANRLCGARYTLDHKTIAVSANEGGHTCLHGGFLGFHKRLWQADIQDNTLLLTRLSPAGEEGFTGDLSVQIAYTLTEENALHIRYRAETTAPTVVNLSNHCYFNLNGQGQGDILGQVAQIMADGYTETVPPMRTTGRILPLAATALDFASPKPFGRDIADPLLAPTRGYDHNFALQGAGLRRAAAVWCPQSGLALTLHTDAPGMQLYTANFLSATGKGGAAYGTHSAFCLEAQNFPDAPNHPAFPSAILRPGEVYQTETVYTLFCTEAFPG